MRTLFLTTLIFVSLLNGQNKKLLFIGIDGCRPDALTQAQTPNIDGLINDGIYINNALCSINGQPTVSGPGWSTMITGVWYDKHGVSDNSFTGSNFDEYPPFNVLLQESGQEYHTASFIMWTPIHTQIFGSTMDYNELHSTYDGSVAQGAADYMSTPNLDVIFLDFDDVDIAGHSYGFSPEVDQYIDAIENVDGYIGWVIDSMENRPTFQNEDWLIMITSDHGGIGYGHGGQTIEERQIPIIMSGTLVSEETIPEQSYLTNLVSTVLNYFGIENNCEWQLDGISMGLTPTEFPPYDICPNCPGPLVAEVDLSTMDIILSWDQNLASDHTYSLYRNDELIAEIDGIETNYVDAPSLIGLNGIAIFYYRIVLESNSTDFTCEAEIVARIPLGITILDENFNNLELFPAEDEAYGACGNSIGPDVLGWTHEPPENWMIDNSNMPEVGTIEWRGWSFASMDFWVDAEDQLRSQFIRADGTVAVADPDEWDDCGNAASFGSYNSILTSPLIQLTNQPIHISFDSHYRQEAPQQVSLTVTNSSGEIIEMLLHYSSDPGSDNDSGDVLNQWLSFIVETDEDEIYFQWEMYDAGNNWYWAIDNVTIQSQTPPIGDLNYDGNLNIFDLLTLAEILVGAISPDTVLNHVSDINQDGETNFSDLILFLIYIMNH
ncbi:MAG: alkaline phosphatase family protein [Candidatus Marinimicrobia bacterium]|nr:alkaline phosphatase family protein [Candidatus Neomarinimicrobiota bacterium]